MKIGSDHDNNRRRKSAVTYQNKKIGKRDTRSGIKGSEGGTSEKRPKKNREYAVKEKPRSRTACFSKA